MGFFIKHAEVLFFPMCVQRKFFSRRGARRKIFSAHTSEKNFSKPVFQRDAVTFGSQRHFWSSTSLSAARRSFRTRSGQKWFLEIFFRVCAQRKIFSRSGVSKRKNFSAQHPKKKISKNHFPDQKTFFAWNLALFPVVGVPGAPGRSIAPKIACEHRGEGTPFLGQFPFF